QGRPLRRTRNDRFLKNRWNRRRLGLRIRRLTGFQLSEVFLAPFFRELFIDVKSRWGHFLNRGFTWCPRFFGCFRRLTGFQLSEVLLAPFFWKLFIDVKSRWRRFFGLDYIFFDAWYESFNCFRFAFADTRFDFVDR